jgi:pyruvate/2-oxoglutarate dehydrogenase complex dihydrolipoamide dehydrogenase (E3) component
LKEAQSILIVGGNAVGVEIAGEFVFSKNFGNKKIDILTRGPRLLS